MDIIDWFLEPFRNEKLNIVKDKKIVEVKNKMFRPSEFSQYVGQERAKRILKNYIEGVKDRNIIFPHTLISGPAGVGKTTLTQIVATELQVPYNYVIGSNIKDYKEILDRVELVEGGILMLDEIHSLERDFAEKFYPLMEDFRDCSPFTLIGATTELGEILKSRKPFYDRFKILVELEEYSIEDLVKIACQYKNKLFMDEKINNETYLTLAQNSRGNPRTIIRLLEATIYFKGNIGLVLDSFGIIKDGITIKDLKVLSYLENNNRGVGIENICIYLDTSSENYLYQIEPFLITRGLIIRTKQGRKITDRGIKTIGELGDFR